MELQSPAHWRCIEFISDLHLQASEQQTFDAFKSYLNTTRADALFILGDLFEVWVGDDCLDSTTRFESVCTALLQETSKRLSVFFIHGNRDFLIGRAFAKAAGLQLLNDPSVLSFGGVKWLLSHGDAMCLGDKSYLAFRDTVRSHEWQSQFLALPLSQRIEQARGMRQQSEHNKQATPIFHDVDSELAHQLLIHHQSTRLIHGHTHKPAMHPLGTEGQRWVLSDWDLDSQPRRGSVLRLETQFAQTAQTEQPTEPSPLLQPVRVSRISV